MKTDSELLLGLLADDCCCCDCEGVRPTITPPETAPRHPQMLGKKMPPLTVLDTDAPFVPPPLYPSYDSPQRPAGLGLPHLPVLIDPEPGVALAREGRFGTQLTEPAGGYLPTMLLSTGEVRRVPGGALEIDHDAGYVDPGPVAVGDPSDLHLPNPADTLLLILERNGQSFWGVTDLQPNPAHPEEYAGPPPLNDLDAPGRPAGLIPRYNLLDTTDLTLRREYGAGLNFDGTVHPPSREASIIGVQARLAARVGLSFRTSRLNPVTGLIETEEFDVSSGFQTRAEGTRDAAGTFIPNPATYRLLAGGVEVTAFNFISGSWMASGNTGSPAGGTGEDAPPPTITRDVGNPALYHFASATFGQLWVRADETRVTLSPETFRRHFLAPGVEVWGDARSCSGLAQGDVHDLSGGAELRVNGRSYSGGSWAALRVGTAIWVLHLDAVLTREVVGGEASSCGLGELMTGICRRPDLIPMRLGVGALHHSWPHDRAALETSGQALHLGAWDPWRDATREEWIAANSARPKRRAEMARPGLILPPAPPLGLTLADSAYTAQWDAVPTGVSPHRLPTQVEVFQEGRGYQVSPAALTALAKPVAYPGTLGVTEDKTSVTGNLRITYPPSPWALVQGRLVLLGRMRTPLREVLVNGQATLPTVLGREPRYAKGKLSPPRGWHPVLLTVPGRFDPSVENSLTIDTRGARLSRLLLSLTGPEQTGSDA